MFCNYWEFEAKLANGSFFVDLLRFQGEQESFLVYYAEKDITNLIIKLFLSSLTILIVCNQCLFTFKCHIPSVIVLFLKVLI